MACAEDLDEEIEAAAPERDGRPQGRCRDVSHPCWRFQVKRLTRQEHSSSLLIHHPSKHQLLTGVAIDSDADKGDDPTRLAIAAGTRDAFGLEPELPGHGIRR